MYKLHCFAQSGNAYKVVLMLRALGVEWEPVFVDFMHGVTRGAEWREEHNVMGEAPILEDGELHLTQSAVILDYLAEQHGCYGGRNTQEWRDILRWMFFDNHKFTSYFASYRFMKSFGPKPPDPAVMAWLRGRIDAAFGVVEKHLAGQDYIVGSHPTIADMSMSAYLFYPQEESGIDLGQEFPHIARWRDRMRELPGWDAPYALMPGERILPKW